jgi:hypothetical protein
MSNKVRPERKITLQDITYKLTWDFDAIAEAEDLLNVPLVTGISQRMVTTPKVSEVRNMFFACAHANHHDLTIDDVRPLVTSKTLVEVWNTVLEAWSDSVIENEEEESFPKDQK